MSEQIGKGVRVESGEVARIRVGRVYARPVVVFYLHSGSQKSVDWSGSPAVARRIAKLLNEAADVAEERYS